MRRATNNQQGFTIVELLIVVVVIAILAAITIVAYNGVTQRAQQTSVTQNVAQAKKALEVYKVTHGSYPLTGNLSAAGVSDGQSAYQYTSQDGSLFCLTGTTGSYSYYVNSTSANNPTVGGCAGHGRGGVAAITNYYVDPKPQNTWPAAIWAGQSGNVATVTNVASTWSESGRANRIAYSAAPHGDGGPTVVLSSSYQPYIGQSFTVVMSLRLIAGTAGLNWRHVEHNQGVVDIQQSGGDQNWNMSLGQTYKAFITFTADATATAPGANMRFYLQLQNKNSSTVVDFADIDMYPGPYDASRNWHSGDSPDWIWNGSANDSTSSGPAS